jgi:methyl coenzyme M reductase subunit D
VIKIKVGSVTIEISTDEESEEVVEEELPFGFSLASETQISAE